MRLRDRRLPAAGDGNNTTMGGPDTLERELTTDLVMLGDRLVDEEFSFDLYRALAGNSLVSERDRQSGHLSLSWRRAEDLVNALRQRAGEQPLVLAQTGGEGDVSRTVAEELRRLGWIARPRDTSQHDDGHVSSPPDPPPAEQGERQAPADPLDTRWEEIAHEEADAGQRLYPGRPGQSAATRGRDAEERARPS